MSKRKTREQVILDWYGDMLKAVATLSEREFDDFIEWDGNRSPWIPTSAWPGFVGRIGMKPGKVAGKTEKSGVLARVSRGIIDRLAAVMHRFDQMFKTLAGFAQKIGKCPWNR